MEQTPDEWTAGAVRAELARRKLSGRQMASRMGMPINTFRRRLNAEVSFGVSELVALADILSVPVVDLLPPAREPAA